MARGLKGRGSWLGERTVSGHPSRGLSGRGGMGLLGPGESAYGLIPGLRSPGPLGRKGRKFASQPTRSFRIMAPGTPAKLTAV
jgi:hypothetical protein